MSFPAKLETFDDSPDGTPFAVATLVKRPSWDGPSGDYALDSPLSGEVYAIDLPLDLTPEAMCIQLKGSPPSIYVASHSPLAGQAQDGHYIHCIRLRDMEIVNVLDVNYLESVLRTTINSPRQLILSPHPHYVDPAIGSHESIRFYKHKIPAFHAPFSLAGFPPVVTNVEPSFHGRLVENQTIEALYIPGESLMNLKAGGFTGRNVLAKLDATNHIEGRILTVKDIRIVPKKNETNTGFPDCVIS